MSLNVLDRRGRTIVTLTPGVVGLLVVEIGSVVLMALTVLASAPSAPLWPAVLFIAVAAVAVTTPDSTAGAITIAGYGGWWLAVVNGPTVTWVVVAAAATLIFHLCLAHAASAPSGATTEPAVIRALIVEVAAGAVIAMGIALVVEAISGAGITTPAVLIGAALGFIALLPRLATAPSRPQ